MILPWEIAVAEVEAGRLRGLAQRLNKQNILYQLRLGDVSKDDVVKTTGEIDAILRNLEEGVPARSIPAPWTQKLAERFDKLDRSWSPIRRIALANSYEQLRRAGEFAPRVDRRRDPLLFKYFDSLIGEFVDQTDKLVMAYDDECMKAGIEICSTARTSGIAAMLIERAAKEAVYVVAGIDADEHRGKLETTIKAYRKVNADNTASEFFQVALDPNRSLSAKAAGELRGSLMRDWDLIQEQLEILSAGDEENFDLRLLLTAQDRMVNKIERLTAALVRYANLAFGA